MGGELFDYTLSLYSNVSIYTSETCQYVCKKRLLLIVWLQKCILKNDEKLKVYMKINQKWFQDYWNFFYCKGIKSFQKWIHIIQLVYKYYEIDVKSVIFRAENFPLKGC